MSDHRIAVVIDPSGAKSGAEATKTALKDVQSEAAKTKDSLAQLASGPAQRAFDLAVASIEKTKLALNDEIAVLRADAAERDKLATVLRLEAQLRGTGVELMAEERASIEQLVATKAGLVASEERANAALAQESAVLERIRGPMQQYAEDVRALDALLAKGAITQAEYNAEQLRSATTAREAAAAQKGEGVGSEVAGAAGVSGLGLVAGGAIAVGAIVSLTNDYQNLQNKLRQVTSSSGELATAQQHLFELSDETGASVDSLATIYQRTITATQHLGISSQDTSHFVDELAKIVSYSGVSSTEAAQGLIQLSQGMGRGVLQGQDLKAVLDDVPEIGRRIADGLGVTTAELREMGSEGKLTTQQLIDGLNKSSDTIDSNFNKRVPTAEQAMNKLHNETEKLAASLGEKLVPALQHLADALGVLDKIHLPDAIAGLISSATSSTATDAFNTASDIAGSPTFGALGQSALTKVQQLPQYNALATQAAGVDKTLEDLDKKIANIDKHQASHLSELKQEGHAAAEAAKQHAEALKKVEDELFPLEKAQREQATAARDLFELMKRGTITYDQAAEALRRWTQAHEETLDPIGAEVEKIDAQAKATLAITQAQKDQLAAETAVKAAIGAGTLTVDQRTGAIDRYLDALKRLHEAEKLAAETSGLGTTKGAGLFAGLSGSPGGEDTAQNAVDAFNAREAPKQTHAAADALDNFAKTVVDVGKTIDSALTGTFNALNDALLKTVETGKASFGDFARTAVRDLEMIALKELEVSAITGIAGLLGGPSTGLGAGGIIPGLGQPGHAATGFSGTVGGSGGTDSKLAAFWVTPGEHIAVTTPEQQRAQAQALAGGQPAAAPTVHVDARPIIVDDPKAQYDVFQTPKGHRDVFDILRRHRGALKAL